MPTFLKTKAELDEQFKKIPIKQARRLFDEEIKAQLQTGDFIFFSGKHWLSSLIRWRSKSAWSHVAMVIRIDEINRIFLIESVIENGVRLIPVSSILKDYHGDEKPYNGRVGWARYEGLTEEQKTIIRSTAFDHLTKQYDRKDFVRVAWRTIIGRQKLFPDKKFTCAELIHDCFQKAKIRLNYDRGLFISPGSIWRNKPVEMKGILL